MSPQILANLALLVLVQNQYIFRNLWNWSTNLIFVKIKLKDYSNFSLHTVADNENFPQVTDFIFIIFYSKINPVHVPGALEE